MSQTQGKRAELWFKEFLRTYYIHNKQDFPLEDTVKLLDAQLQFKFNWARRFLKKQFSTANEWIDSILLHNRRITAEPYEKARLTDVLLDKTLATDAIAVVKDNQGKEHRIAVDVTANPHKEQEKLNAIRGKKDVRDPPGFNQNANFSVVRQKLGITKHLVLVINPDNPPDPERLLNQIYAFANQPAITGSIDAWKPDAQRPQMAATQTPQQLWQKYSQEAPINSDLQRQIAIAEAVMRDGLAAKLPAILACDPFTQKIRREQGEQKARQHIQVIVRAVSTKLNAAKQPQRSQQKEKGKGKENER